MSKRGIPELKCVKAADATDEKLLTLSWEPPHPLSWNYWVLSHLDILYVEAC